jgi:hypothetical protein
MIIFNNRWYHDEWYLFNQYNRAFYISFSFKCKNCNYKLKNLTRIITEPDGLLCERCLKLIRDQQQQS